MNTLRIQCDSMKNRYMAWLQESIDGESPVRQVNSWEHLNSIANSNHVERSAITFEDGTLELCDAAWGKPN